MRPPLDPKAPSVVVLVRLPRALVKALDARAAEERTTRSQVLRDALVSALKRKPRHPKGGTDA